MTAVSSRCPDPEVIAAFVAGSLSGAELQMTAEHLRVCEDCRDVAAEAARIDREGVPEAAEPKRSIQPWWIAVAAAALAGLAFLSYRAFAPSHRSESAIQQLVSASPKNARYVEARLTGGFAWAPLRSQRGGVSADAERMQLIGAAGTVLRQTQDDPSAEARHAAALAHLLAGDVKEANDLLSSAPSNSRSWSDLAAARYTEAVEANEPAELARALAAADAALRLDARLPEALFNRALIVERLGLREQAREAWKRYLAVDDASPWAEEARRHLESLRPVAAFQEELQEHYASLQRDAAAAQKLAGRYPQEARQWGETGILGRWARAATDGDDAGASGHLALARAFGESISHRGEMMLLRSVEAIEHAAPQRRLLLARAHLHFHEAKQAFNQGQPAAAELLYAQARQEFEEGGSPFALVAEYFRANTLYSQGKLAESRSIIERLISSAPPEFRAHRAQLAWQLGLADAADSRWGDTIRAFNLSASTFASLGETNYANRMRDLLAEVYDRIGNRRMAWKNRIAALREIGLSDPQRLRGSLEAAARGAALNREWPVTVSLLGLQLEAPDNGDQLLRTEILLERAKIQARLGDRVSATSDYRRAVATIPQIADASFRERATADGMTVEPILEANPRKAVPALSRAIDFHRLHGRRMFLPELYLERGRAHQSIGELHDAADDFESGIREVESQRDSADTANAGWGTVAIGEELFEEAISAAARRGDANGAFDYAERARMQEERGNSREGKTTMDAGIVVLEYAALPDRLMIFVVRHGRVRLVEQKISRPELASQVQRIARTVMGSDIGRFRQASFLLHATLLAPVEADIQGAATIAFIPDATVEPVPFAALLDRNGRYLVEDHAVVTAPSFALCARLSARRTTTNHDNPRLLLIQGPAATGGENLWFAQREANAVAAQYGPANVISVAGDRAAFQQRASDADIIHFVGHAVIPDDSAAAALVTSTDPGTAGHLDASDIATMSFRHTRVVVLAACGTARDSHNPGDASISVARAFLRAGVPGVVATLWPIDDDLAADFFPRLHARLVQGLSPSQALRETQLEWIHRPNVPPRMWAAVQMIGT